MVNEVDPKSEEWDKEKYPGAVLLSDHIQKFVDEGKLIVRDTHYEEISDTFDQECLDRAKYNVRLGKAYFKDGQLQYLNDMNLYLSIEPYERIFVESYEVFDMPPNVVGVYDLRIRGCLWGLSLQTGLQLDPNYRGRFFCPVFNFSDTEVKLKYKDQMASIQFLYTTRPTEHTKEYRGKQDLMTLSDALIDPRGSGIKKLWEESSLWSVRYNNMVSSVFQGMAFIIGALAVVVSTVSIAVTRNTPGAEITLAIGACCIILAIGLLIIFQIKRKK